MASLPKPHIRLVTDEKKEAAITSWVPRTTQKSAGLVAIQLRSRHGVVTDHLTPDAAEEFSKYLLVAAKAAREKA